MISFLTPRPPLIASSIQLLRNTNGWSAERVRHEYLCWLPKFFWHLIKVHEDGEGIVISFLFRRFELLAFKLNHQHNRSDRQVLNIVGGILSARGNRGRLEFREVQNGRFIIAAVREFHPRLPRYIYPWTQKLLHVFVMRAFKSHLMRRP